MTISWLVTGASGQLGHDLLEILGRRPGDTVVGLTRGELDLTHEAAVRERVRGWLADELAGAGRLLHVSTDYVFDGRACEPYPVDAPVAPRSVYGRTKAAGERAVAAAGGDATTVRTAWVYGRHGQNFVRTMVRLEHERDTVSVVDDQVGAPTWSADLAAGLVELGTREEPAPPVLHLTNSGQVSWFGFARAVFEELGADPERVLPTTTEAFPRPAPRPAFSVLDLSAWTAAGLAAPRPWRDALHVAMEHGFG